MIHLHHLYIVDADLISFQYCPFLNNKQLFSKCTRTSFVLPNFWQESPAKLSVFSKLNCEKPGCSFPRLLTFFLTYLLLLLIKLTGCFTISAILSSLIVRAAILVKNLKNVVKQCVSYSNFTIFLNIWKILVFKKKKLNVFFIVSIFFCHYA